MFVVTVDVPQVTSTRRTPGAKDTSSSEYESAYSASVGPAVKVTNQGRKHRGYSAIGDAKYCRS